MTRLLYKLLAVAILTGSVSIGYLWWNYKSSLNQPLSLTENNFILKVEKGSNLTRVVYRLAKAGIIEKPRYLLWYARLHDNGHTLHIGEYEFNQSDTAARLIDHLLTGKVKQYAIVFIEGRTFQQMLAVLAQSRDINHTISNMTDEQIMQVLGYSGVHPEGRFMPDTYYFPSGIRDTKLLKQAYQSMQAYLDKQWPERDVGLPFKNSYEALILASIVEKETGQASERQAIAGVFIRRLQKRMRLQTDPTIIYGMGRRYKGNIRRQDLKRDNPYNTYRRFGLPPTPIAMPSRESIYATLHPDNTENLYFVAKGDGSHKFSTSLDEHNRAVIKYQLKGHKRSFSSFKNKK